MKDLSQCRAEIDAIDTELLALLEKRMRVAESVAKYKLANNMKVFDETRERAVLDKIGERSPEDVREKLVGTYDG
ncbi:MAG: chorismate mutase, partial [Clostridia bacterium]|nr:chorismate mutase [Clostridia bacterium]